jgi:Holliday junction resolvase-like predicted endonuclease
MASERMKARGTMAAAAYLERSGIQVVDQDYSTKNGIIPIVATDGNVLVRVRVNIRTEQGPPVKLPTRPTLKKYHQQMAEYISQVVIGVADLEVRYDDIDITVIGEDKALLRHVRGAY